MSLYLAAGHGAPTDPASASEHLPTSRPRRYPSDTTDAEWHIMAGYIPAGGTAAGRGGGPVTYPRRDIVDAIRYLDHNSCVWRALPIDFPPWPTVYHYFRTWNRDGTLNQLHNALREQVRLAEGRQPQPSAAILDSQSIRAAETVARTSRGFDGGKKINGRKRHIAVDTCGLLLVVLVTSAGIQDRNAAGGAASASRATSPVSVCQYLTAVPADQAPGGGVRGEERLDRAWANVAAVPAVAIWNTCPTTRAWWSSQEMRTGGGWQAGTTIPRNRCPAPTRQLCNLDVVAGNGAFPARVTGVAGRRAASS